MRNLCVILVSAVLSGCVAGAEIKRVENLSPIEVKADGQAKPIQFKKIVVKLSRGEPIGALQAGLVCAGQDQLVWKGGRVTISDEDLTEAFRDELVKANYSVVGDPDALFEDPTEWKAELLVAGLVKNLKANICYPMAGLGDWSKSKGEAYMVVDWQVYSRLDRKVVFQAQTEGSFQQSSSQKDGAQDIFINAFAQATRNLLANQNFNRLATSVTTIAASPAAAPSLLSVATPATFTTAFQQNSAVIRQSVVTVFAGDGLGSGFFIADGYVMTNSHVVGGAKFLKVKLVTDREIVGEVMRTDSRRDVALVKTEQVGLPGLPIADTEPQVGSRVYAIGSPLDEKNSQTVSSGVLSSYRVEDGMRFIQSDVNVLRGSSGGPLVDEFGNVIGLAVSGLMALRQAPMGINYFVPIGDAELALALSAKRSP